MFIQCMLVLFLWVSQLPGMQTRGLQSTQDGIDVRQNERIEYLTEAQADERIKVETLTRAVIALTSKMDVYTERINFIGYLFGFILTSLQVIQLLQNYRNKPKRRFGGDS